MTHYDIQTNDEGRFIIDTDNLEKDIYDININFDGNDVYYDDSVRKKITLVNLPDSIELTATEQHIYKNKSSIISAIVKDINENIITNEPIYFYVNNKLVSSTKTDANGVAQYIYIGKGVGEVNIKAKVKNIEESIQIIDELIIKSIIIDAPNIVMIGDKVEIVATVIDLDDNVVPNKEVNFYDIEGVLLNPTPIITNDKGEAIFEYQGIGSNLYNDIRAVFGDIKSSYCTILDMMKPVYISISKIEPNLDYVKNKQISIISIYVQDMFHREIPNCPVEFYIPDVTDSRQVGITNHDGIARFEYIGEGIGEIKLIASTKINNFDDNIEVSRNIIDYIFYDKCDEENGLNNYDIFKIVDPESIIVEYWNDCYYITKINENSGALLIKDLQLKNFVFEADICYYSETVIQNLCTGLSLVFDNSHYFFAVYQKESSYCFSLIKFYTDDYEQESKLIIFSEDFNIPETDETDTDIHIKLEKFNNKCIIEIGINNIYEDNSVIFRKSFDDIFLNEEVVRLGVGFDSMNIDHCSGIKNIKIRELDTTIFEEPYNILLECDNNIISSYDESILTFTVFNINGEPMSNTSIDLYKNNNKIEELQTDENGVVEYIYYSEGIGNVLFFAKNNNVLSNKITIEDYYYFDNCQYRREYSPLLVDSRNVAPPIEFDRDHYVLDDVEDYYGGFQLCDLNDKIEASIEFRLSNTDNGTEVLLGICQEESNYSFSIRATNNGNIDIFVRSNTFFSANPIYVYQDYSYNEYYRLKLKKDGYWVKFSFETLDGIELTSYTTSLSMDNIEIFFGFHSGINHAIFIKNIKVIKI